MTFSKSVYRKKELPPWDLNQAKKRIMDLLAERDHSEKELITKLKRRCDAETVQKALEWARQQNWLPSEEKVQEMVIHSLGRRKKGQRAINQKLKEMGLAPVRLSLEDETEKALQALTVKFRPTLMQGLDYKSAQKEKARVFRFLAGRGFDSSVAQKAFQDYFKKSHTTKSEGDYYDEEF